MDQTHPDEFKPSKFDLIMLPRKHLTNAPIRLCWFTSWSVFFCFFFIWFFTSQSTIFQLCWDGSSWVEPVLSKDKCVLLKDKTQWRRWGSNLLPLGLESSTLPLCSLQASLCLCCKHTTKSVFSCGKAHVTSKTAATNTYVHIFANMALWEKSDNKLCTNCDYIRQKQQYTRRPLNSHKSFAADNIFKFCLCHRGNK